MTKQVRYGLCLLFIIIAAVGVIATAVAGRPEVQRFATAAVIGTPIDKTFRVAHELGDCAYEEAEKKYNNYEEYGLKIEALRDRVLLTGTPNKIGTAKAAVKYEKNGKTVYAVLSINIEGSETTLNFSDTVPMGEAVEEQYQVKHGYNECSFGEARERENNYGDFGLTFEVTENGVRLYGMPTHPGTVTATAKYTKDGNAVYAAVRVLVDGGERSGSYEIGVAANTEVNEFVEVTHGIDGAVPTEASELTNDYADFGLTMEVTKTGIALRGMPTKLGDAHCAALWQGDGISFCAELTVHITQGGTTRVQKHTAFVGDPFILMLDYAECGIDTKKYRVSKSDEHMDNLKEFNLTADYGKTAMTVEGTPVEPGKATVTVEYENEREDSFLTLEINVVTPEMSTVSVEAEVNKLISQIITLDGEAYTVSQTTAYAGTAKDYGIKVSCDGERITINGKPKKAGCAYEYFIIGRDNQVSYLTVRINIAQSKNGIRMEAHSDGKDVTLSAEIPKLGTYFMTLYRNTAYSYEGGSAAKGYDDRRSTEQEIEIGLNFSRLSAPYYYFYLMCTDGEERYYSNIVRVANPEYKAPRFENPFPDVTDDAPFYSELCEAAALGLLSAAEEDAYQPDADMKISDAIEFAARLNQYYLEGEVTLEPSASGSPYMSYVEYAIANGIISRNQYLGRYSDTATHADCAEILAFALPENEYTATLPGISIEDVPRNASYADAVYKLCRAGIMTLSDSETKKNCFFPDTAMTRGEIPAVLIRMIEPAKRSDS